MQGRRNQYAVWMVIFMLLFAGAACGRTAGREAEKGPLPENQRDRTMEQLGERDGVHHGVTKELRDEVEEIREDIREREWEEASKRVERLDVQWADLQRRARTNAGEPFWTSSAIDEFVDDKAILRRQIDTRDQPGAKATVDKMLALIDRHLSGTANR